MQLDAGDIINQVRKDYPHEYELSLRNALIERYEAENATLRAELEQLRGQRPPAEVTFQRTGSVAEANTVYDPLSDPLAGIPDGGHDDPPQR